MVLSLGSNPTFTYQIDGPTTTYLGRGDHHDAKYDGMVVTSKLTELDAFAIQERCVRQVADTATQDHADRRVISLTH